MPELAWTARPLVLQSRIWRTVIIYQVDGLVLAWSRVPTGIMSATGDSEATSNEYYFLVAFDEKKPPWPYLRPVLERINS